MKSIIGNVLLWLISGVISCGILHAVHYAVGLGWLASFGVVALSWVIAILIMFWCALTLRLIWRDSDEQR